MNKFLSIIMSLVMMLTMSVNIFAAERHAEPVAMEVDDGIIDFSNISHMAPNESVEYQTIDKDGNSATIGIQRVDRGTRASATEWRVWFTGVVINCEFYMTVNNDKVTSVYDEKIVIIGGTYDDSRLTKTSTYGKLSFKAESWGPIVTGTCWLKGIVAGSDNNIRVSHSM